MWWRWRTEGHIKACCIVQCGQRTELQEPQPSPGCPRRNGYFNPPEPELCGQYVECVDGVATPGKCSTGVGWSPPILACTTPAQVSFPGLALIGRVTTLLRSHWSRGSE